jgi:hypothetical protein
MISEFSDLDGHFEFYAIVTPDGKIPTLHDDTRLNDPAEWYTSPIGTLAHLSDFSLVFTDWDDAHADYERHREKLPKGTKIRAFTVSVEEIENPYEGVEDSKQ